MPISGLWVSSRNAPKVRLLSSTGITRLHQYYEPVRHPKRPSLLLTESWLRATTSHRWGFPCCLSILLSHMPSLLPRRDRSRSVARWLDQQRPSPSVKQVGSRITRFEACSAFTHVMACVLADSPREPFPRVLQSNSLPP